MTQKMQEYQRQRINAIRTKRHLSLLILLKKKKKQKQQKKQKKKNCAL